MELLELELCPPLELWLLPDELPLLEWLPELPLELCPPEPEPEEELLWPAPPPEPPELPPLPLELELGLPLEPELEEPELGTKSCCGGGRRGSTGLPRPAEGSEPEEESRGETALAPEPLLPLEALPPAAFCELALAEPELVTTPPG